jgi:hypothetical protein
MRAVDTMAFQTRWKTTWCRIEKKSVKYRLGFITLTLPSGQVHDDNTIKRVCLNDFLTKIRNNHDCKKFIWKSEPQKNGNIHFHITIDKYIHYTLIRKYWLASVEKLGYVTAFAAKFGHYYPPATEIHSVRKIKNVAAYLGKYLTKESPVRKMQGRIWSLSYELSRFKFPTYTIDENLYWAIDEATKKVKGFWKQFDFCEILQMKLDQLLNLITPDERQNLEYDLGTRLDYLIKS